MPLQVLIVDDSPSMRKVIRRVLQLSDYSDVVCHEASDGLEALSMLVTLRVDLIMTDINMPYMNGEEFVERLAGSGKGLPAPTLVISTDQSEERVSRMLKLGVRGYVTKPFTPESLKQRLQKSWRVKAMPVQSCEFALIGAVENVLEQMCFISLIAETEICVGPDVDARPFLSALQDESEQRLGKQVMFSGPLRGNVSFWFSRRLAFALAANLLGSEAAETEENDVADALGEIANMVCGSMLGALEGKQTFTLQTPVGAGSPAPGTGSTCLFHTEEGLLLASQSFEEVGR